MEIINVLGKLLAKKLNISSPAARGLIKLSIKDEVGPFQPLEKLNLEDFLRIIRRALKKRLISLKVQRPQTIVEEICEYLIENPSLLSITKL